ncbi:hypothetical protein ACVWXM_003223 [Bradyrhizobium sp. GM7.3]
MCAPGARTDSLDERRGAAGARTLPKGSALEAEDGNRPRRRADEHEIADDDLPTDWHAYPVYLTNEKKLAPRSVQVTVAALRFLYRATLGLDWDFDQMIQCAKGAKDTGLHSQP